MSTFLIIGAIFGYMFGGVMFAAFIKVIFDTIKEEKKKKNST